MVFFFIALLFCFVFSCSVFTTSYVDLRYEFIVELCEDVFGVVGVEVVLRFFCLDSLYIYKST